MALISRISAIKILKFQFNFSLKYYELFKCMMLIKLVKTDTVMLIDVQRENAILSCKTCNGYMSSNCLYCDNIIFVGRLRLVSSRMNIGYRWKNWNADLEQTWNR